MDKQEIRNLCDLSEFNKELKVDGIKHLSITEFDKETHLRRIDLEIEKLLLEKVEISERIDNRCRLLDNLQSDFFDIHYIFESDFNHNGGTCTIVSEDNLKLLLKLDNIHFISIRSFKNSFDSSYLPDFIPDLHLERLKNPQHNWILHLKYH